MNMKINHDVMSLGLTHAQNVGINTFPQTQHTAPDQSEEKTFQPIRDQYVIFSTNQSSVYDNLNQSEISILYSEPMRGWFVSPDNVITDHETSFLLQFSETSLLQCLILFYVSTRRNPDTCVNSTLSN